MGSLLSESKQLSFSNPTHSANSLKDSIGNNICLILAGKGMGKGGGKGKGKDKAKVKAKATAKAKVKTKRR